MKLTMLGTGHAMVRECYNTCFVLQEGKQCFLTDTGGGREILFRLSDAGIDLRAITDIFISHRHLDHITGMLWLMRMFSNQFMRQGRTEEVRIYGHAGVCGILQEMRKLIFPNFTDERCRIIPVSDGETINILNYPVTFFDLHSTKAEQYGWTMSFDEKKLTFLGDEGFHEENRQYAENSTWLMHEAFCLESESDRYHPHLIAHSTVKDACENAERLHVKNLILFHTEDRHLQERKTLYAQEGKEYFSGQLMIPDDLESIVL